MNDTSATGNYYGIRAICMISGLTDRTIRSYIASGILQGEKINGLWHFTPEQVDAFLRDPAVKPSILAKRNALVYDFMQDTRKTDHKMCAILDIPSEDVKDTAEFFCYAINTGECSDLNYSFDSTNGTPRVILQGGTQDVMELIRRYYAR